MSGHQCSSCEINFNSMSELNEHLKTRRHQKEHEFKKDIRCGVHITGFPYNKSKEDVLQYFSKFGGIRKSFVGPTMSYMIIVYEKEEEAKAVLSTEHIIDNCKLRLKKRLPPPLSHTDNEELVSHAKLVDSLESIANFENQITKFMQLMTPNLQQMWGIYNVVNLDVQEALRGYFQYYNVLNFGSSITSTQLNSSDLDIYLDFKYKPSDIKETLKTVKNALLRTRRFRNIIYISSAKVPIVKFVHNKTGMKADISCINRLGVENSNLIRYFLSLDSRLRSVAIVIKYWAKILEICGRNHLFTSYSMMLMLIFYLQQKYSFPSVHELQCSTKPTDPEICWNMNIFPRDTRKTYKISSVPILDILKCFFEYYSNFDFGTKIICPYLGKVVEKTCFADIDTVPKEFHLYKRVSGSVQPLDYKQPLCLQDPFELNRNTCKIIFPNILDRFIAASSSAVKILSGNQKKMLINLFSPLVNSPPTSKVETTSNSDCYCICLNKPSVLNYLKSDTDGDIPDLAWFKHTLNFCHTVFEKVLRLELNPMENNKSARIADQQDVHDSDKFHATCYVNLWGARNIKNQELTKDCKTSLEKEIAISASIWKENEGIRPSTPLFECKIIFNCLRKPTRINIEIIKISSYKKIYKSFGIYIGSKLPLWFLMYTKELNQQHYSELLKG